MTLVDLFFIVIGVGSTLATLVFAVANMSDRVSKL